MDLAEAGRPTTRSPSAWHANSLAVEQRRWFSSPAPKPSGVGTEGHGRTDYGPTDHGPRTPFVPPRTSNRFTRLNGFGLDLDDKVVYN